MWDGDSGCGSRDNVYVLSRVRRSSGGCGVAQLGCGVAQKSAA